MPRSDRLPNSKAARTNTTRHSTPSQDNNQSKSEHDKNEKRPYWIVAFIQGFSAGVGHAIGSSVSKLVTAALTAGSTYLMYRTRVGYKLATLIWEEGRVDRFVERTRFTGRLMVGGTAFVAVAYLGYKAIKAITWIMSKTKSKPDPPEDQ